MSDETKPLRWTTEPPRVPGYWLMKGGGFRDRQVMRHFDETDVGEPATLAEYYAGVLFAGPIPEPIDADEPDAPTLRDDTATLDDLARIAYEACVGPRDKFPDLTPFERHSESYRRDWRNAVKAVLAAAPLCEEVAAVLVDMDGRAGLMGDQGAFQPWRERLRTALAEGGGA